jgi:hypothetical protein
MSIFGRIIAAQQQVYLNTGRLWGINSLEISPSIGADPLTYIGIGNKPVNQIQNSEQYSDVSINNNLIDYDPFIQYTGSDCFNMFVLQNQGDLDNNYSLISGYLNNYNLKFSVGQPIQTSVEIKFINDCGKISTGNMDLNAYNQLIKIPNNIYEDTEKKYHIPSFHSTNLTINEIQTQRIIDASIDLRINRTPIYNLGNKVPSKINIIYPIVVNCSFVFEINNSYSGMQLQSFPANKQVQNITFSLYENNNGSNLIASYGFSGMTEINESYKTSTDGNVSVTKQFVGYIYN